MVTALLDMKAALDAVLHQSFQGAEPFAHALKDAFEHFINQRANRPVRAGTHGAVIFCLGIRDEGLGDTQHQQPARQPAGARLAPMML